MEQTLGKRIAENRKRLKMTQDSLAEQLGITAQAVSKWENDQSCPDITMLPKLAEIFGITTDELLGHTAQEKVHEAEVVEPKAEADTGINLCWDSEKGDGKWELRWDSGKRSAVTFALLVLLVGALTLVARIMQWEVSFWSILWPSVLLTYGLSALVRRFSIFHLALCLFSGYSLIANLGIWRLDIVGELVLPIMIVFFGLGLLIDALKKPNKPRFRVIHNGGNSNKTKYECSNSAECFNCSLSFGERTHQVNLPCLAGGDASVSFGELTVDLTGCESVKEGCTIAANCSFGEIVILVPRRFRVEPISNAAFASVNITGHPDTDAAQILYLEANVSFGEVQIKYI